MEEQWVAFMQLRGLWFDPEFGLLPVGGLATLITFTARFPYLILLNLFVNMNKY